MSSKGTRTPSFGLSPSSNTPEVITIGDSDEEESQDLFDSVSKNVEKDCVEVRDSDDLFSSPESNKSSLSEKWLFTRSPIRRFLAPQRDSRLERRKFCRKSNVSRDSSVFVSPQRSLFPRITWNRRKLSSDVWVKNRMEEMAHKFKKRDEIMNNIVKDDKDFFEILHGGAIDRVQMKTKEEFREGDVIRKQADRAKLKGVPHATSKAYFDALELSPASKERRINEVSRVRVVTEKLPSTPENYWEIGFPTESEQRRRGLITEVHLPKKCARNLFRPQSSK